MRQLSNYQGYQKECIHAFHITSHKDIQFTKWARWDQSTIKTTCRLDRFTGQVSINTARRNTEMASLLPQKVSAPSWSTAATAQRENQLSVESWRGHKGKERKGRKTLPAATCRAANLPTAFTCTSHITPDHAETNTIQSAWCQKNS